MYIVDLSWLHFLGKKRLPAVTEITHEIHRGFTKLCQHCFLLTETFGLQDAQEIFWEAAGRWDPVGATESLTTWNTPTDFMIWWYFFPLETYQTSEVLKSLQFVSFCWCKAVFFFFGPQNCIHTWVWCAHDRGIPQGLEGLFVTPPKANTEPNQKSSKWKGKSSPKPKNTSLGSKKTCAFSQGVVVTWSIFCQNIKNSAKTVQKSQSFGGDPPWDRNGPEFFRSCSLTVTWTCHPDAHAWFGWWNLTNDSMSPPPKKRMSISRFQHHQFHIEGICIVSSFCFIAWQLRMPTHKSQCHNVFLHPPPVGQGGMIPSFPRVDPWSVAEIWSKARSHPFLLILLRIAWRSHRKLEALKRAVILAGGPANLG